MKDKKFNNVTPLYANHMSFHSGYINFMLDIVARVFDVPVHDVFGVGFTPLFR